MNKEEKYKVLYEGSNPNVDKLIELYKKDKFKARVVFMNGSKSNYTKQDVVMFFHENGKFNIVQIIKQFGISITNKVYTYKSVVNEIIYKDNKLWFRFKHIKVFRLIQLNNDILRQWNTDTKDEVFKFLQDRFSWLRFVLENNVPLAYNTIIKNKLYNLNDCLKHMYKVPLPVAKMFFKHNITFALNGNYTTWIMSLKSYRKYLINIENLKEEFILNTYFKDSLKMAKTLDKRINCSWSLKRLKQEHDDWSKEITNIVLENEPLRELNVNKLFVEFGLKYNYRLLNTNKELLYEGIRQSHCVGTYIDAVDNGDSGIYHIDGYTLELRKEQVFKTDFSVSHYRLKINQFKGFNNLTNAPEELFNEVSDKLNEFNKTIKIEDESVNLLSANKPIEHVNHDIFEL